MTYDNLLIYSPVDIDLGCFHLGFLGLKMLCEHILLLFLGKYLGWELLGQRAAVYLFLWEAAKQLSGGLSYFTCLPSVLLLHSPEEKLSQSQTVMTS